LLQNLWVLVLILFLLGICQAHLDVGENTLIMWLHGNGVAPYMNGLHFFFGLGSFIAPLLIAQSLRINENLNLAFWIMAVVILVPVLFLLRFPAPTLENSPRQNTALAEKTPVALIVFLLLFFLGYVGAEMTLGNWLFTYATKASTMSAEQAAYLTSIFWGVFTFSRLAAVFISKKLSITVMLTGNLAGGAVTLILLILFVNQPTFLWVGAPLHALFIASTFPTAMNLAEQIGAVSSRVTSLIFIVASLGGMISPWIAGQWIESATPVVIIWIVLANFMIPIVMFGLITLFQQRRKQKKPPLTEATLTGNLNQ
jgi:FHS family Na+ dependent glucose MFS transporter 1